MSMLKDPSQKYEAVQCVNIANRTWPSKSLSHAPIWCSVDLRDGNQALIEPMGLEKKVELFKLLCEIGFKEIEVGFPSASEIEYAFLRFLIEKKLIPDGVKIQVLTQAREHLIRRTFEAIRGSEHAIVHLYNSTSTLQRKVVFGMSREEIKKIAIDGTRLCKKLAKDVGGTKVSLEYSPESFTGTEMDYAVDVCNAVITEWEPTVENKIIINLPATVELSTPNVFADQIEWFCNQVNQRDKVVVSLHTHNDRGCAVAAAQLGLLAGGDRVEGTLFGNGERTGNVDLITIALNLYCDGINPNLDLSNLPRIADVCERLTQLPIPPRQPYAGELVFTAFSGSHQDAINKGLIHTSASDSKKWEVPYLPIDPQDIGRTYENIIRINSQSGKGGVAYVMRSEHGITMPKAMHPEFGKVVQTVTDQDNRELSPEELWEIFYKEYVLANFPLELIDFGADSSLSSHQVKCNFDLVINGEKKGIEGHGNGPIDALKEALSGELGLSFNVIDYSQHSLSGGANAEAISYIGVSLVDGPVFWGVGVDSNITLSGLKALISALNRGLKSRL